MKLNKYIGMAALAVAFTACQDDTLEGGKQQHGIYTLSGKMAGGAAMSRAQIELGNQDPSKESFMWNEGDAFTVYQSSNDSWTESVFTIQDYSETETVDKKNATFSTDTPAEQGSYVALYPARRSMMGNDLVDFSVSKVLDFPDKSEFNKTWSTYLQTNMFMVANGTLSDTGENTVNFRHLMALARITYTNQSENELQISQFGLGGSICIPDNPYYILNNSEYQLSSSDCSNYYMLTTNGLTVAPGDSTDLYLLFCPTSLYEEGSLDIHFNYADGSDSKYVSLPTSQIAGANGGKYCLEAGKRYWFHLTDDGRGLYLSKEYTTDVVTIENPGLSLALQEVLERDYGITIELDENNHATLSQMDANLVTSLEFSSGFDKTPISSLEGIEHFKNLTYIWCSGYGIETCDFSQNKALRFVNLDHNKLTSLNLNQNTELTYVSCMGNSNLTSLEIDKCLNLQALEVSGTALTNESLVIPNKENITMLGYGKTALTFNFEEFLSLKEFFCNDLGLTNLDFLPDSTKAQLTYLYCTDNNLDTLDLKKYPNLTNFYCQGNKIKVLDITPLEHLTDLNCGNQQDNIRLEVIATETQQETWRNEWSGSQSNQNAFLQGEFSTKEITFTNKGFAVALYKWLGNGKVTLYPDSTAMMLEGDVLATTDLNFGESNRMSTLEGIEHFVNLEALTCASAGLTEADFRANTKLERVIIRGNNFQSLDFSNQPNLLNLSCGSNDNLTKIDLTNCDKLFLLHVQNCARLSSLNIPNPSALNRLYYGHTQVTFTNEQLEEFTSVNTLGCAGRFSDTGVLDLPAAMKARLVYLECQNNNLTSMDLTEYKSLQTLECYENNLTSLDVTPVKDVLSNLRCFSNQIETLDVSSLTNLWNLECGIQDNGINLILTVNDAQQETWRNEWSGIWSNEKAYLQGDEIPVSIPNGNGSIGNFGEGGEF